MSLPKPIGAVLAGVLVIPLIACGGGSSPGTPSGAGPPATLVSATSVSSAASELDGPVIELETTFSTTYYDVTGTTTEEIFASIEANGPTDDAGSQGSGLTSVEWEYVWSYDKAPSGECSIRELTINADITVQLPRHVDEASLSPGLLESWRTYAQGVADHEQRHVDIYLEGAKTIQAALRELRIAPDCDVLEQRIDQVWKDQQALIDAQQEAFHAEEDARLAAKRGPLAAQIEANRAKLDQLRAQIYQMDQEIAHLRAEISVFDTEVERLDNEIKLINDQFPNELPDTIRERLEDLIEQSNDLLFVYNQRVEQHNSTIYVRNALSDEYDALLAETNALVDEYNWTR